MFITKLGNPGGWQCVTHTVCAGLSILYLSVLHCGCCMCSCLLFVLMNTTILCMVHVCAEYVNHLCIHNSDLPWAISKLAL